MKIPWQRMLACHFRVAIKRVLVIWVIVKNGLKFVNKGLVMSFKLNTDKNANLSLYVPIGFGSPVQIVPLLKGGEGGRGRACPKTGFVSFVLFLKFEQSMQPLNDQVPIVSYRYVRRFFEFMEVRQVRMRHLPMQKKLFQDVSGDAEGCISIKQLLLLSSAANEMLSDEKAGFEFGQQLDLSTHGLLGYTVLNAHNPFQLIETIVNHISVSVPLFRLSVQRHGHGAIISMQDLWDLGDAKSLITKIYLGSIYGIVRTLCSDIRFECSFLPLKTSLWQALCRGSEWRFGSADTKVVLAEIYRPSKSHQERLLKNGMYSSKPWEIAAPIDVMGTDNNLTNQVRDHVIKDLRFANVEKSAELLSMSPRHLRKRLAQEGSSFREISTDIRKRFADMYLQNTPLPIHDIGLKLGFGDQSSFTRAFQRWTGETPGAARKRSESTQL